MGQKSDIVLEKGSKGSKEKGSKDIDALSMGGGHSLTKGAEELTLKGFTPPETNTEGRQPEGLEKGEVLFVSNPKPSTLNPKPSTLNPQP